MPSLANKARLQTITGVSPSGGINSVAPLSQQAPTDCIQETNILPGAQGASVRLGSSVHTAIAGSAGSGVRTIIPFTGVDGAHDKLFVATNEGIYDCSVTGAARSLSLAFLTTTGLAGYGNTTNFSTLADHYCVYCDEANGYYLYTEASGTWQKVGLGVQATSTYTPCTSNTSGTANCIINGVVFTAPFTTDADTTVNNLIALIEADPATLAFVTPTLVAHQMLLTAVAQGTGGDGVTTTTNGANGASFSSATTTGGVDGLYGDTANGGPTPDPNLFVFCCPFQDRLWFCELNSSNGWYLQFGSIFGTAFQFNFGANQTAGGSLKCMANWTVDSGSGVGNNLAVLSEAGNISVYQGTDPATAGSFNLVGVWYVGGFPVSRNITSSDGGDVLITTSLGVISLSQYLQGLSLADRSLYSTRKIASLIATEVAENQALQGWQLIVTPDEQAVLLAVPQADGTVHMYAMPYATRNWSVLSGRNANAMGVWLNKLYFGTNKASSPLYEVTGSLDFVQLDGSGGQPIPFTIFGSFQSYGQPAIRKRPQMARVSFVTATSPVNFTLAARFDYDITPAPPAPVPSPPTGGSLWDSALWDISLWDAGGTANASASWESVVGLAGEGRMVAMALNGYATEPTVLESITVLYESGSQSMGFL